MELIFNELSLQPQVDSVHAVNVLIENLVKTYARSKSQGFDKIRFHQVLKK